MRGRQRKLQLERLEPRLVLTECFTFPDATQMIPAADVDSVYVDFDWIWTGPYTRVRGPDKGLTLSSLHHPHRVKVAYTSGEENKEGDANRNRGIAEFDVSSISQLSPGATVELAYHSHGTPGSYSIIGYATDGSPQVTTDDYDRPGTFSRTLALNDPNKDCAYIDPDPKPRVGGPWGRPTHFDHILDVTGLILEAIKDGKETAGFRFRALGADGGASFGSLNYGFVISEMRLYVRQPPADLVVTSIGWREGVEFEYEVLNANLPANSSIAVYWASGETFDDVIGEPVYTVPAQKSVGSHGPITIPKSSLSDPPPGATHIVVIADPPSANKPNGEIDESNEHNNLFSLKVPDIGVLGLRWNETRGPEVSLPQRGVDFAYEVTQTDLPEATEIAFFWAKPSSTPGEEWIRLDRLDLDETTPAEIITGQGRAGQDEQGNWRRAIPEDPNSPIIFNEPGRWGVPHPEATHLLFVVDPDNEVVESNEKNNEVALVLHSESSILFNSIHSSTPTKHTLDLEFWPGSGEGKSLTLSEAEVALGVDHFNWIQWVTGVPDTWTIKTLYGLDSNTSREDLGIEEDFRIYYKNADARIRQGFRTPKFLDPIATRNPGDRRVVVYDHNRDGKPDGLELVVHEHSPDEYYYYLRELSPPVVSYGSYPKMLAFRDSPSSPIQSWGSPFDGASGDRPHVAFSTTLVGVNYLDSGASTNSHKYWDPKGYKLTFKWKSDAVTDRSGGVFFSGEGVQPGETVVSGGVFDVASTDQVLEVVPPVPSDADQDHNSVLARSATGTEVGLTAFSTSPVEAPVVYSLLDDAGRRFDIDPVTGQVTVADGDLLDFEAVGSHTITIRAESGDLISDLASFEIVVLDTHPWRNRDLRWDVNNDTVVSISDLLAVVAFLRERGHAFALPVEFAPPDGPPPYVDVNEDNVGSIADLLDVVVRLRSERLSGDQGEEELHDAVSAVTIFDPGVPRWNLFTTPARRELVPPVRSIPNSFDPILPTAASHDAATSADPLVDDIGLDMDDDASSLEEIMDTIIPDVLAVRPHGDGHFGRWLGLDVRAASTEAPAGRQTATPPRPSPET